MLIFQQLVSCAVQLYYGHRLKILSRSQTLMFVIWVVCYLEHKKTSSLTSAIVRLLLPKVYQVLSLEESRSHPDWVSPGYSIRKSLLFRWVGV